jgi:membrane AbrB-like protein
VTSASSPFALRAGRPGQSGHRRQGDAEEVQVGEQRRLWRLLDGLVVVAGAVAAGFALDLIGLPSPALFGGLLAGLVRALAGSTQAVVPGGASAVAQAVVGVAIGALLDPETLGTVGANWPAVLLVSVGTLLLSLGAGLLLRLHRGISPVTGAFSMIAGGAAGIVVMADQLGADTRMVALLQNLRVLLIVVLMPVAATVVYGAGPGAGGSAGGTGGPGWAVGLLFTVACGVVGMVVGRLCRLPVAALLGPMIVAAAADLSGLSAGAEVPGILVDVAFLLIGLQVGVTFSRTSLRAISAALPLALVIILVLIVGCAGLGAALAAATGTSQLDGYLATTPGGMNAVLATATDSGADTTFVLAVQVLRLFVMLLSAPLVARWLRRGRTG